ncbi:MAG: hypothetical protein BWX44_01284 [Spirochaetes bacterium ADurb.Bin001]|mgnify:CR=1 FL=1|jgi:hypothetical protein|nr:MAG: hypothetical protein BWX44_01284 [Spirochaetes bacterium ADurb.Bin001]
MEVRTLVEMGRQRPSELIITAKLHRIRLY